MIKDKPTKKQKDKEQKSLIYEGMLSRILELLSQNKMTGKALSENLGLVQSAVTDWKAGRSHPTTMQVAKMSIVFNVTTDYLIFGKPVVVGLSRFEADLVEYSRKIGTAYKSALLNVAAVFACQEAAREENEK